MGIREILIDRDNMTPSEADILIQDVKDTLCYFRAYGDQRGVENVCADFFGLENDDINELL